MKAKLTCLLAGFILPGLIIAQLSPGDLSEFHKHLEGISNCTECHVIGHKVENENCLACHKILNERIIRDKGFHASSEVKNKECISCHSDHHGRKFDIVHIDTIHFKHHLTGFELKGKHESSDCYKCHTKSHIEDLEILKKKFTFMGLNTDCKSCHEDYHQQTLSEDCASCHTEISFNKPENFNHDKANFQLKGKHKTVACEKCHKTINYNNKEMKQFRGLSFSNCTNCHTDKHNNQFGQNCTKCHSVESFSQIKKINEFDHDQTGYLLEGKHNSVSCKKCHQSKLTDPLNHKFCKDCHSDYHKNQFEKDGESEDFSSCHTNTGFDISTYTLERHNRADFMLTGDHAATPCFACHKKENDWNFRKLGTQCSNCHENIHKGIMNEKFMAVNSCSNCHMSTFWKEVTFDHSTTKFALQGAHKEQECAACHFQTDSSENRIQRFEGLPVNCNSCHTDHHYGQFTVDKISTCESCHTFNSWKPERFDHNSTNFILDGKHKDVACNQCHKTVSKNNKSFILYKIEDYQCISCHK